MTHKQELQVPENGAQSIPCAFQSTLDWKYVLDNETVLSLYRRGQTQTWRAEDIDWRVDVDVDHVFREGGGALNCDQFNELLRPPRRLNSDEVRAFNVQSAAFLLSQFLHGEQGALLAAAKLVQAAPSVDAKLYAGSQVADEARHVEVYHRYLVDKLRVSYAIHPSLGELLGEVLSAREWDITYLGMQIVVEGLAMAAFAMMRSVLPQESLIDEITRRVMRDESRHVAFGVVVLEELYQRGLSSRELAVREDFAIMAVNLLHDRLLMQPVLERLNLGGPEWSRWVKDTMFMRAFRQMLFAKIVPNLRRIGLLTPRVKDALVSLDLIKHANYEDSLQYDGVAPPVELWKLMQPLVGGRTRGT